MRKVLVALALMLFGTAHAYEYSSSSPRLRERGSQRGR